MARRRLRRLRPKPVATITIPAAASGIEFEPVKGSCCDAGSAATVMPATVMPALAVVLVSPCATKLSGTVALVVVSPAKLAFVVDVVVELDVVVEELVVVDDEVVVDDPVVVVSMTMVVPATCVVVDSGTVVVVLQPQCFSVVEVLCHVVVVFWQLVLPCHWRT